MKSYRSKQFQKLYDQLPISIQEQAQAAYKLFRTNPFHPSLHFKQIRSDAPVYSVRVGRSYRAIGIWKGDVIVWTWIGTHADYDKYY